VLDAELSGEIISRANNYFERYRTRSGDCRNMPRSRHSVAPQYRSRWAMSRHSWFAARLPCSGAFDASGRRQRQSGRLISSSGRNVMTLVRRTTIAAISLAGLVALGVASASATSGFNSEVAVTKLVAPFTLGKDADSAKTTPLPLIRVAPITCGGGCWKNLIPRVNGASPPPKVQTVQPKIRVTPPSVRVKP
jgi:hypothetical protein